MSLILCEKCSLHYLKTEGQCPHCTSSKRGTASTSMLTAVLLGLSLTACGDKERDTGDTDTQDTAQDTGGGDQPMYGVPDTGFDIVDLDNDGWDSELDCDDNDAYTHPGAAEYDSTSDCMRDADSDGYGDSVATSPIVAGTDCNDSDPTIHPGATDPAKDCAE